MRDCSLFDFDGTITSKDTTKILIFELIKLRPLRMFISSWLFARIFVAIIKKKNIQEYKNEIIGYLISGLTKEELKVSLFNFQNKVKLYYRSFLIDKINEHILNNNLVLIVTASPFFAIEECFEDDSIIVIGTEFVFENNRYTGKYSHNCFGKNKVDQILKWKSKKNYHLNYIEAWSDSISDYPMLSLADNRYWIGDKLLNDLILVNDPSGNFIDKDFI